MSGETLYFKKHLNLHLEQYYQLHEEESPRNSQATRTKGGICLYLSGNLQVAYKVMTLNSGKKTVQWNWDLIPLPCTVISGVNKLAGNQHKHLTFIYRHRSLIGEVENSGVGENSDEE